MASLNGAKVIALKSLGEKMALLTVELGGKQGDIKAWKSDIDGVAPGYEFKSGETEKKPPYNKPNAPANEHETWLKSPAKSGRGGGAGIQQASKEKNAVIAKTSADKNASINYSANLKSATSCMEMAVTTLGPGLDINDYRTRTFDLYQIVQEVAAIGSAKAK